MKLMRHNDVAMDVRIRRRDGNRIYGTFRTQMLNPGPHLFAAYTHRDKTYIVRHIGYNQSRYAKTLNGIVELEELA